MDYEESQIQVLSMAYVQKKRKKSNPALSVTNVEIDISFPY